MPWTITVTRVIRLTFLALVALPACGEPAEREGGTAGDTATETEPAAIVVDDEPQDSVIAEQRLAWVRQERLDTLPIGELTARIGRTFVGAPYVPGTLEAEGPERLIVNLRTFDCVTFVESSLALARAAKLGGGYDTFKRELMRIRYRDGKLNGYPSRLHYFSEWIANNQEKGIVRNITRELGGIEDREPIRFMTSNADRYRQLADESVRREIRETEERLSQVPRYYIPEDRIVSIASRIRNGDVIAATSVLEGLDVVHTGLALWVDDELHLMHAPLVGKSVEISKVPLAERIQAIETQDGIMVARPLEPRR